jgi:3',5'-nucleoside bisphosphate phosphatase
VKGRVDGCVEEKADLHMHTTYSDGACTPSELIANAKQAGLDIISITDHDSVSGIDEAIEVGKMSGVEVIAGMELSANYDGSEVHILGYFMDHTDKTLVESLTAFQTARMKRAQRIVDKLNKMNIPLGLDDVLEHVTGDSVGRPHIATALVNEGHATSYQQAFNKYIGDGRPAYEQKCHFSPEETIQLIARSGGLSFLAHPGRLISEETLLRLINAGLDGIEVVHPAHTPELMNYYRGIVNEYFLLESGGSDFHGGDKEDNETLGQYAIPVSCVEMMRRRLVS